MSEDDKPQESEQNEADVDYAYANNTFFEATVWDLKILFGELSPSKLGPQGVDWHTVITMPWAQAKLVSYYLRLNLELYESEHGKIRIPAQMIPPAPNLAPDAKESTKAMVSRLVQIHKDFLNSLIEQD